MNFKKAIFAGITMALAAAATMANATIVTVDAKLNSTGGGVAKDTGIQLNAGQAFTVTVDPNETWNFAGGAPGYWFNADGMGWIYTLSNPDGSVFSGHYASLIGQIGTGTANAGNFFTVGTSFSGVANATGELNFYFVDSDAANNVGAVNADVETGNNVPEPATVGLMGLGMLALARRRRA